MTTERFAPATTPAGVRTEVRTSAGEFEGELLEMREGALVVLTDEGGDAPPGAPAKRTLRVIPFGSIVRARFEGVGSGADITGGRPPSAPVRERLRLLSRFPYGISPGIEEGLLKAHGQTGFAGVDR
jgi:hypothetical protein